MYLTHSINADISFVVRARGAIFYFAGHGKEEIKVFCNAVQLTDVFICTEKKSSCLLSKANLWSGQFKGYSYWTANAITLPTGTLKHFLLEMEWKGQKFAIKTSKVTRIGTHFLFYFLFCSVIIEENFQPILIKTSYGEGDLARCAIKQFRICSFLHPPLFINSLKEPRTTAKHAALPRCTLSLPFSV